MKQHAITITGDARELIAERMASAITGLIREVSGADDQAVIDRSCLTVVYDMVVELSQSHKFSTRLAALELGCRFMLCGLGVGGSPAAFLREARQSDKYSRVQGRIG